MIFGFEEPETFLHPETQTLLYNKLIAMTENGYQVMITTHAPNIVAETNIGDIIFVQKMELTISYVKVKTLAYKR